MPADYDPNDKRTGPRTIHDPVFYESPRQSTIRDCFLKRPPGWKRTCQRCGADPWPNWMHCNECKYYLLENMNMGYMPDYTQRTYRVGPGTGSNYD
jgi:hypothetical protein